MNDQQNYEIPPNKTLLNIIAAYLGHTNFIIVHQIVGSKTAIDTTQGKDGTIKILKDCIAGIENVGKDNRCN